MSACRVIRGTTRRALPSTGSEQNVALDERSSRVSKFSNDVSDIATFAGTSNAGTYLERLLVSSDLDLKRQKNRGHDESANRLAFNAFADPISQIDGNNQRAKFPSVAVWTLFDLFASIRAVYLTPFYNTSASFEPSVAWRLVPIPDTIGLYLLSKLHYSYLDS